MTHAPLRDLVRLTAAIRASQEARMQQLVADERRIRAGIAALEAACDDARALSAADLAGPRRVGADMLWQGWVSRSRQQMQMRLARVLASKGRVLDGLRRAHGRAAASERLLLAALGEERKTRARAAIAQDQSLVVLKSWQPRN